MKMEVLSRAPRPSSELIPGSAPLGVCCAPRCRERCMGKLTWPCPAALAARARRTGGSGV